jgi:hypothetical protein
MPRELVVSVELIRTEPGRGESRGGWMAYLSTDGLGELDDAGAGELKCRPRLGELLTEIQRIIDELRDWLGPLRIEVTLDGSAAAARVAARTERVSLPR